MIQNNGAYATWIGLRASRDFDSLDDILNYNLRYLYFGPEQQVGNTDALSYAFYNKIYHHVIPDLWEAIKFLNLGYQENSFYTAARDNTLKKMLTPAEYAAYMHWSASELPSYEGQRLLENVAIATAVVAGGYVLGSAIAAAGAPATGSIAGVTLGESATVAPGLIGLEAGASAGVIGGAGSLGGAITVSEIAAATYLEQIISAGERAAVQYGTDQITNAITGGKKSPSATSAPAVNTQVERENLNDYLNKNKDKIAFVLSALAGLAYLLI